jgi:hypothetical protein
LAKNMSGGSLVSFLRQHYTSSSASAGALAAYIQAAGPGRAAERPKGRAGEDHANQPGARDRAKAARPAEPGAAAPTGAAGAATAPAADPAGKRKARDRLVRPTDPASEPPPQSSRKSRRPGAAEPTEGTAAIAEPASTAAAAPPPMPGEPVASVAPAAAQTEIPAPAGFAEPLP